jgi:hypothetical protein
MRCPNMHLVPRPGQFFESREQFPASTRPKSGSLPNIPRGYITQTMTSRHRTFRGNPILTRIPLTESLPARVQGNLSRRDMPRNSLVLTISLEEDEFWEQAVLKIVRGSEEKVVRCTFVGFFLDTRGRDELGGTPWHSTACMSCT